MRASVRSLPLLLVGCAVLLGSAALAGCTAAKANLQVVSAEESLRTARERGANGVAVYEYVMAERYLDKAKEELGQSEFRIADALARQSAEWADRAIIFAEKRGRSELLLDDFTERPAPAPAPSAPAPTPTVPEGLEDILGPATPAPAPSPAPSPSPSPAPSPTVPEGLEDILGPATPSPAPSPTPSPTVPEGLEDILGPATPTPAPAPP